MCKQEICLKFENPIDTVPSGHPPMYLNEDNNYFTTLTNIQELITQYSLIMIHGSHAVKF